MAVPRGTATLNKNNALDCPPTLKSPAFSRNISGNAPTFPANRVRQTAWIWTAGDYGTNHERMSAHRAPRRRREVIYMALHTIRSREIIKIIGSRDYLEYGDDNALLRELTDIVDEALQREVERRRNR